MASRASLYPSISAGGNHTGAPPATSASATKQRQINHLASRLAELSNRMQALDRQVVTAGEHAGMMRQLGVQHAALFMASSTILVHEKAEQQQ